MATKKRPARPAKAKKPAAGTKKGHGKGAAGAGGAAGGITSGGSYLFAVPQPTTGESLFGTKVADAGYYSYLVKLAQAVPPPRQTPPVMNLSEVLGNAAVGAIQQAGRCVFHSVGDTGPVKGPQSLDAVVQRMIADFADPGADRPAFFFHLGDVVYNFGEPEYYYEQFYDPYRDYPAPIFAIPGNHDGMVYQADKLVPLEAFMAQFCAVQPTHQREAGGLVRTTMTQPGVYFTLEAPFVSIIGLYSNALEGPGVISSEGNRYPQVGDDQKTFLTSELTRLGAARKAGKQGAVVLTMHHPPISGDARHGGSPNMLADIDACCSKAGFAPDAVLSGHAHFYQRFTRHAQGRQTPFLVAGSGGHGLQHMQTHPTTGHVRTPVKTQNNDVTLEKYYATYGYLRLVASMQNLQIEFYEVGPSQGATKSATDRVVVDLKTQQLTSQPMLAHAQSGH